MTTLPKININGTSAYSLRDEYYEAYKLLTKAEEFIRESVTCHPRDFQCNNPGDYDRARQERETVVRKLDECIEYLDQWIMNASDSIYS
jgi:hypothetical protein